MHPFTWRGTDNTQDQSLEVCLLCCHLVIAYSHSHQLTEVKKSISLEDICLFLAIASRRDSRPPSVRQMY